ncbi:hypothetical protein [Hymenobacter guriensis]|nr:hypothetical protein [Hymenobacter guriensis]
MSRKSLPELYLYVHKRGEYREDAVLAALDELARRGEQPAEAEAIRAELLPIVEQQQEEKKQLAVRDVEPTAATAYVPTEDTGPALYTPGTIVLFSMLFSFLAGGILLVMNMFRLKEPGKAIRVVVFMAAFLAAQYYGLLWLNAEYGPQIQVAQVQIVSVVVNFVAVLIYLLYFWPRYVGAQPYVSRRWLPALIVCLVLLYALFKVYMAGIAK